MSLRQANAHFNGNVERVGIPTDKFSELVIQDSANIAARGVSKAKTNLENAHADFDKARITILSASNELQKQLEGSSRNAKEAVSRAKDTAAQMSDAMNKITKVLGPDFDRRLAQLEQLTSCMERLSDLNKSGKLKSVLLALQS